LAVFLWGLDPTYDCEGDCSHPRDRRWTNFTIRERSTQGNWVTINLIERIYHITSNDWNTVELVALFLVEWNGGTLLDTTGQPLQFTAMRNRLLDETCFLDQWERAVAWHDPAQNPRL